MALGSTQPLVKMSTRNIFLGVKAAGALGWRPHHLHVPNVMKMWEPKPPGTLRATPGLLRDCFTFPFLRFFCRHPVKLNARKINKSLVTQLSITKTKNTLLLLQEPFSQSYIVTPYFCYINFNIILYAYVSYFSFSGQKFCMHFSLPLRILHDQL